jgi:hypothetical protein
MATLQEIATFVDSIKNVLFAMMFVLIGFYVTVAPGITPEYAGQWVAVAMTVGGVYIGTRIEKGKSKPLLPE